MTGGRIEALWRRARSSSFMKNSLFYSLNLLSQIFFQLGYFVIISRAFGPGGYGIFASLSAASLIVAMFVGWGSERVLIQKVAVEPESFRELFGSALILHLLTFAPLGALAFATLVLLEHGTLSWTGLALIVVAECAFRKLVMLGQCGFFAHDKSIKHLILDVVSQFLRIVFAILAVVFSDPLTLDVWAVWYVAGAAFTAVVVLGYAIYDLGAPRISFHFPNLRLGFLYSVELGSVASMREIDKPVVVAALGPEAGGVYTAAFRLINAASAPLKGVLMAMYTRFFRHADKGVGAGMAFAVKLLPFVGGLALVLAVGIFVGAGFVPWILGEEYAEVVPLLRLMAVFPLAIGALGVGSDLLRAIGMQGMRVLLIGLAALVVIPAVWWGAKQGDVAGATIARVAVEVLMALITWTIVRRRTARAEGEERAAGSAAQ